MKDVYVVLEVGPPEISIKGTATIKYRPYIFAIAQLEMVG
jgi:hypothetical protein